jgi:hypothetical protein
MAVLFRAVGASAEKGLLKQQALMIRDIPV